jgi:hypothetical protein
VQHHPAATAAAEGTPRPRCLWMHLCRAAWRALQLPASLLWCDAWRLHVTPAYPGGAAAVKLVFEPWLVWQYRTHC